VSVRPLGNWVTGKPQLVYGHPLTGGAGRPGSTEVTCNFTVLDLPTPCDIDVTAKSYASAADAVSGYNGSLTSDGAIFDRYLKGYGDEAYGAYHQGRVDDFRVSGYQVVLRKDNLVLVVDVSVYRMGYLTKDAMLPRVTAQAQAVLAVVPRA
jgi:hypothetical protein